MTKEEAIRFANDLKNNYTIDFDKLPEFCEMAISALEKNESAEEWYKLLCEKWNEGNLVCNVPKGMTNGEVIQTLFPTIESRLDERTGIMLVKWEDGTCKTFKASWWNAPYRKGGE